MGFPAKPISSPARTDSFPPPLMRFLSSTVATKTSARSRSARMLVRKKTSAIETQEPSSPKVTCMGQVRIRKHSKPHETATERMGRWIPTAFFCNHFSGRIKWKAAWTSFFSSETEVGGKTGKSEHDAEKDDSKEGFVPFVCSTPSILNRTRSAPCPSSSLANGFNGSPLMAENTEEEERTDLENTEMAQPESHPVFVCDQKRRSSSQSEGRNDFYREGSRSERMRNRGDGSSFRPQILRRSKSEPSRIAEKLNPESNSRKIGKFVMSRFLSCQTTRD